MFYSSSLVCLCTTDYWPGIHTTGFLVANVNIFGSSCFQWLPSTHGLNDVRTVWCVKSKVSRMNAMWPCGVKIVHIVHFSPKVYLKIIGRNCICKAAYTPNLYLWYSYNGCHLVMTFATKLKFLVTAVHVSPAQLLC